MSEKKTALMVPIHLDFCFVSKKDRESHKHRQTLAHADFSKLPYKHGEGLANPNTPFLTEAILNPPFSDNQPGQEPHSLAAGLHIHWAVPEALTQGHHRQDSTEVVYPALPNRWLVRLKLNGTEHLRIVESDYLHPVGTDGEGAVSYPLTPADIAFAPGTNPGADALAQPFRYLGRHYILHKKGDSWPFTEQAADRLKHLTAVGYGDPSFASYYPNCHSVFGLHYSKSMDKSDLKDGDIIQVAGWYADLENDPVHLVVKELQQEGTHTTGEAVMEALQDRYGWANGETLRKDRHADPLKDYALHQLICFSELRVNKDKSVSNTERLKPHRISVGHTGTEALGALLHHQKADQDPDTQRELQLAYGMLKPRWEGSQLDIWEHLQAERHLQGFVPLPSDTYWGLKTTTPEQLQVPDWQQLPDGLVEQLYQVNVHWAERQQQEHDRRYQQHLLFAEWCKYQTAKYHEDGEHHDPNLIQARMKNTLMPTLREGQEQGTSTASDVDLEVATLQNLLAAYSTGQLLENTTEFGIPAQQAVLNADLQQATALPAGLQLVGTDKAPEWETNLPLSKQCVRISEGHLEATAAAPARAFSCWIKVEDAEGSSFFPVQPGHATDDSAFWQRLVINQKQRVQGLDLAEVSFPTSRWTYVYVDLKEPLPAGIPLRLLGTGTGGTRPGAVAGVRLWAKPLTEQQQAWDHNMLGQNELELTQTPGPQYYRPADPVLLIEGPGMDPMRHSGHGNWYGTEGGLYCFLEQGMWDTDGNLLLHNINKKQHTVIDQQQQWIDKHKKEGDPHQDPIGKRHWHTQPWHPTLLEWEVEYVPYGPENNLSSASRLYGPGFFQANGQVPTDYPDWEALPEKALGEASTYRGRSVLTPQAKHNLLKRLYDELGRIPYASAHLPGEGSEAWQASKPTLEYQPYHSQETVTESLKSYQAWASPRLAKAAASVANYYTELGNSAMALATTHVLSQSLGTLHTSLIMHQGGLHAPIADPLGSPEDQAFAQEVQHCLQDYLLRQSAQPEADFHPLRHGFLRIRQLRCLDNFGKIKEFEFHSGQDTLVKAATLSTPQTPSGIDPAQDLWLPPRIVQPCRLHFRWLDAHHPERDLTQYPDSHPVVGWFMHDPLGGYLAVYDGEGLPLGRISPTGEWLAFPGTTAPRPLAEIPSALRKVLEPLVTDSAHTKAQALSQLITAAVENMAPEDTAYADGWERLLGHPLALVRARVDLHLQHAPVADHHWQTDHQKDQGIRETDHFEHVAVPLILGAHHRVNDGLVGYWIEDAQESLFDMCHTPLTGYTGGYVQSFDSDNPALTLTADPKAAPQNLTLLMDPHSAVHLTTGLLPVKTITIPQKSFAAAMRRISTAFFRTRVLSPDSRVTLPHSHDDGHEWTWFQQQRHTWQEVSEHGIVEQAALRSEFPEANADGLWSQLIAQNWIRPTAPGRATLVPTDERRQQQLPGFGKILDRVHQFLLRGQLLTPSTQTTFYDDLVIKEGWLRLTPEQDPNA